jgi:D-glycero-alpha-D-manno-heptose-7-phosphate kinase
MIISKTPMRISFAGGGSDLKDYYQHGYGSVVSTAINKFMYVTLNRTFDTYIRLGYSKIEYVERVDDIEHALAREAFKLLGVSHGGLDMVYVGDMLPAHVGSGLGASSSLTVGILNAVHLLCGESVSTETLAREACNIEVDVLGRPMGKQDQYAAAFGGLNYIRFNQDEVVSVEPIDCLQVTKESLARRLLLFYTGVNTQSDIILTEQQRRTPDNLHVLDKMVELAENLRDALTDNDLTRFGNILHEGWVLKQKLASKITNPVIDGYYELARNAGAIGGKVLGSAGGGFLLLYCEEPDQNRVREALAELREVSFDFEPEGSRIIYTSD